MLWSLLQLTVPVFYVIGLLAVIKWVVHRGHSDVEQERNRLIERLNNELGNAGLSKDTRTHLEAIRDSIGVSVSAQPSVRGSGIHNQATYLFPSHQAGEQEKSLERAQHDGPNSSRAPLDNINLLLYLGAFLLVVSAGIFVAYNFSVLSGGIKTLLIAIFAAIFYLGGLTLYHYSVKLRPAGTTFVAIGLVVTPLVGLAAYYYLFDHQNGGLLWLFVSFISLLLHYVAYQITRQTYLAYLMAATTLSLFESMVLVIGLPVYWYSWVMALVAIAFVVYQKAHHRLAEDQQTLRLSADIFLPLSIVMSLLYANVSGFGQLGLSLSLAGIYYLLMATLVEKKTQKIYLILSLAAFPLAITSGLWDRTSHLVIASIVMGLAGLYAYFSDRFTNANAKLLLAPSAALTAILSTVIIYDRSGYLTLFIALTSLLSLTLAIRTRNSGLALIAELASLLVPLIGLRFALPHPASYLVLTFVYAVLVGGLIFWRLKLRGWPNNGDSVGLTGYTLGILATLTSAALAGHLSFLIFGVIGAVVIVGLSYLERTPEMVLIAAGLSYLSVWQLTLSHDSPEFNGAVILTVLGSGFYFLGRFGEFDARRKFSWRVAGLAGPVFGLFVGALASPAIIMPTISLVVAAILIYLEAKTSRLPKLLDLSAALLVAALEWAFYTNGYTQLQLYSAPWAFYLFWLGYARRLQGRPIMDPFIGSGLAVLTFPLAAQALGASSPWYGLALVAEAVLLIFIGMSTQYKLITYWGAATLVAETLYQLRNFFFALPKYAISAGLGLILIVTAVILLQRRGSEPRR